MQHRAEVWDPERKAALGGARDAALRDGDEGSDALDLAGVHRKTARETEGGEESMAVAEIRDDLRAAHEMPPRGLRLDREHEVVGKAAVDRRPEGAAERDAAEGFGACVDIEGAACGFHFAEKCDEEAPALVVDDAAKPGEAVSEADLPARDVMGNELGVGALQEVEESQEQCEGSGCGEGTLVDRAAPTEEVLSRRKRTLLPVRRTPVCSMVHGGI
eukprot:jgi/Tetstr1/446799/TSEL_034280.t1